MARKVGRYKAAFKDKVMQDVKSGMTQQDAAKKHKVTPTTIRAWLRKTEQPEQRTARKTGAASTTSSRSGRTVARMLREISDKYGEAADSIERAEALAETILKM